MGKKSLEITIGGKFNRLTIIDIAPPYIRPSGQSQKMVICQCECGTITPPKAYYRIKAGRTKSCGCLFNEISLKNLRYNGIKLTDEERIRRRKESKRKSNQKRRKEIGSRTFTSWVMMRRRCYNAKHIGYSNYGGRGIKVCDRWNIIDGKKTGYNNFLKDMGERPEGMTLDRIDSNGNYEPSNCKWSTYKEQANNRNPRKSTKYHVGEKYGEIEIINKLNGYYNVICFCGKERKVSTKRLSRVIKEGKKCNCT